MANRIRNQYNNDRLMWLGAFAPGLRTLGPPLQEPEKLSTPEGYPKKQGPISISPMKFNAGSNMPVDDKSKVFINGKEFDFAGISTYDEFPSIVDNDLITIWVYAPTSDLPAQAKVLFNFLPTLTGAAPNFPVSFSATFYGYVNGLSIATNVPIGSPVADGTTPGTYGILLSLETTKLLAYSEEEIGQLVFTATDINGKQTEIGYRLQVVMCEKIERYQAVGHDGLAGGPFIHDAYSTVSTYSAYPGLFSPFSDLVTLGAFPFLHYTTDADGNILPSVDSLSQSSVSGAATSFTINLPLLPQIPNTPTGLYYSKEEYASALNTALGPVGQTTQIANSTYTSPFSPPGDIFGVPPRNTVVTSLELIAFETTWKEVQVQTLPNPTSDPDAIYEEIIVQSTPRLATYDRVLVNNFADYRWPQVTVPYFDPDNPPAFYGPGVLDVTNGTYPAGQPYKISARPIIYASTYRLSQYKDPQNPEADPQPGRVVYLTVDTTVELTDAQYQALRDAGVESLDDFQSFVDANPAIGDIQTTTEFNLDLTTNQMQSILGTGEDLDEAQMQQLLDRLQFIPTEDFLAASNRNSLQTKITPASKDPTNLDKLKMAGKIVSGVNSLLTLGKIIANIGVLQTPLGVVMLLNTGINIYNATEAASGLYNNRMPQYIPTVNETFFNAFKQLIVPTPSRPRRIP